MARYIDADEIKKEHKRFIGYLDEDMIWRLNFVTDKIPTADVTEVKHGHWNIEKIGVKNYKGTCSICGLYYEDEPRQILTFSDMEYCPRCGAKMDEDPERKRIEVLEKVSRMIAEGKIPNEVYDEYLSDTPLGFRTADGVLEYLLYGE